MANPPWHDPAGTPSADAARERARRGAAGLLGAWARALAAPLRHRGTLTFVLPVADLPAGMAAFAAAGCGSLAVLPLWPRAGLAARLALLRGIKGGRGKMRLPAGLVLHAADGGYTAAAEAVLRGGAAVEV
jgi:tRNA1(Val) A37 N6-methylase TrmN6